jgi:hypothetical protein
VLAELPPATLRVGNINLPAGGGAWFRIFPYSFVRKALQECERRSVPGTFYVHPWELDPDQPMLEAPRFDRWKHYSGLKRTSVRLRRLLSEFRFQSMAVSAKALAG